MHNLPLPLSTDQNGLGASPWQLLAGWSVIRPSPTDALAAAEMLDGFLKTAVKTGIPFSYANRIMEGIQLTLVNLGLIYMEKNIPLKVFVRLFLQSEKSTENSVKGWGHFLVEHIQDRIEARGSESIHLVDAYVYPEG